MAHVNLLICCVAAAGPGPISAVCVSEAVGNHTVVFCCPVLLSEWSAGGASQVRNGDAFNKTAGIAVE